MPVHDNATQGSKSSSDTLACPAMLLLLTIGSRTRANAHQRMRTFPRHLKTSVCIHAGLMSRAAKEPMHPTSSVRCQCKTTLRNGSKSSFDRRACRPSQWQSNKTGSVQETGSTTTRAHNASSHQRGPETNDASSARLSLSATRPMAQISQEPTYCRSLAWTMVELSR